MLLPNETRLNTFNFEKIQYIQDKLQDAQFHLSFAPAMLVLVSDSNALLNETLATFTSNVSQSSSLALRQSTLLLNMRTLVLEFVADTSGSIHAVSSQISVCHFPFPHWLYLRYAYGCNWISLHVYVS